MTPVAPDPEELSTLREAYARQRAMRSMACGAFVAFATATTPPTPERGTKRIHMEESDSDTHATLPDPYERLKLRREQALEARAKRRGVANALQKTTIRGVAEAIRETTYLDPAKLADKLAENEG